MISRTFAKAKRLVSFPANTWAMMSRKYDYDYNYDPEGTSPVRPDPYTELPPSPKSSKRANRDHGNFQRSSGSPLTARTYEFSRPRSPTPPPVVREPSPRYLAISSEPSSRIDDPKLLRKLLILDLNGTLVFRSPHQRRNAYQQPGARPLRSVHPRPYLSSFKSYIFHPRVKEWLDTMVWSSAQPHSVSDMVEKALGSKDGLRAVWARDTLGLSEEAYFRKTQTTKDLEKPWAALGHSARTTFLLDDSPLKAHLQPWNHLCIREYVSELRQVDVKVRDAEALRQRREQLETNAPEEEAEGEEALPRDRRKEKKRKQREERLASLSPAELQPVDSEGRPLEYDQTLLAIIGVLDAIKHEDNVAGWMRSGGLYNSSRRPSTPTHKKRRKSNESDRSTDAEEPPVSPPPSSPLVRSISGGEHSLEESTAIPLDLYVWFGDRETFQFWVDRGKRALEELDIQVQHGVIGNSI